VLFNGSDLSPFFVSQVRIVNLAPVEFPLECYIKEKIGTQPPSDAPYVTLGPS